MAVRRKEEEQRTEEQTTPKTERNAIHCIHLTVAVGCIEAGTLFTAVEPVFFFLCTHRGLYRHVTQGAVSCYYFIVANRI